MAQRRVIESAAETSRTEPEQKADMQENPVESTQKTPKTAKVVEASKKPAVKAKPGPAKPGVQDRRAQKPSIQSKKSRSVKPSAEKKAVPAPVQKKSAAKPVSSSKKSSHSKKVMAKKSMAEKKTDEKDKRSDDSPSEGMGFIPVIVSILLFIAFLAAVVYTTQNPLLSDPQFGDFKAKEVQTFPQLMTKIALLDAKYSTQWHEERLGKDMINPQFIDAYLEQLDLLEQAVNASNGNETDINLAFLEVRRRMLKSEKTFQEALKFGTQGVVTETFSCDERRINTVLTASRLYNESFEVGQKAVPRLDEVLRKSTEARQLVGVNLAKPRWFVSEFGNIKYLAETNIELVNKLCFPEKVAPPEDDQVLKI